MSENLNPTQLVEMLRGEQRQRWQGGERILVEAYFQRHPALQADANCALQMVYQEVLLREQHGETPDLTEYLRRFPQFASQLTPLFEVHRALESSFWLKGTVVDTPNPVPPPDTGMAGAEWPSITGYEILGELGRGAMGVVYRARQIGLNRLVALKMILAGAYAGAAEVARFRAEAEAQARLQHPHIVQIYEIGDSDGRPYFALELVEGGSLAQKLTGTPQPARWAAALVVTLARAVHVAHECGLVHRDLKPANILLAADGTPKISDFGLAKQLQGEAGQSASGAIVGTPTYMAPEQAAGHSKLIGPPADVYALGVILYELLTGRPPFLAATPLDTLLQVRFQEPVPLRRLQPKVSRDLETLCLKCLQKAPGQRYATALALAQDLRRWLQGEPIQARPVGQGERLWRWCRRNPVVASLSTAAAFLLVAGTGISSYFAVQANQRAQEALLEKGRTVQAYRKTLKALDLLSPQMMDEWLGKQKQLSPEHKKFLEQALASYQELAHDTGPDEATRVGVAVAHGRIGHIWHTLGQAAEAEAAYRHAKKLLQGLTADFPTVPEYQRDLAISHTNLAVLLQETGRAQEAENAYRDALKLYPQLIADFPTVSEYRQQLAITDHRLGILLADTGRAADAERVFRDALSLRQQLAAVSPNLPAYRQELAESHNDLGKLLWAAGKKPDAESAFRNALELVQQLVAEYPTVAEHRRALAMSHNNLGALRQATGRAQEAERAFREAVKQYERLVADFPTVPSYRQELAGSYNNLSVLLEASGRAQEAERVYRDTLKLQQQLADAFPAVLAYRNDLASTMYNLADLLRTNKQFQPARQLLEQAMVHHQTALKGNPHHPQYRAYFRDNRTLLAQTLLDLGEHAAAADIAGQLVQSAVDPVDDVYNAACFLSRCVPLAEHDRQLPETQRKRLAQTYTDRALATLRQAVQNGYKDVAHLLKDTDLDPLRSCPDFKRLVADLEK
jgi:tetratricopeptide (TPR) repeat protein